MKLPMEKLQKLEYISMRLEKVKQSNPIIEDMRWLVKELRDAWIKEEETLRGEEAI